MALVDGFAKGIAIGNDIRRTRISEDDAKLRQKQTETDIDYKEYLMAQKKLGDADEETKKQLSAISFRMDSDPN